MLNEINEKILSKNYLLKIKTISGNIRKKILHKGVDLVYGKHHFLVIHGSTNELSNGTNSAKIPKMLKMCHQVTKLSSQVS